MSATIVDQCRRTYLFDAALDTSYPFNTERDDQLVNHLHSGLVTPTLQSTLETLQSLSGTILNLKLGSNENVYWYKLQSYNGLIDYTIEDNDLRLEINQSRLHTILLRGACRGATGATGVDGVDGANGLPGTAEVYSNLNVDGVLAIINDQVVVTLDTPISLRLYHNGALSLTLTIQLDGQHTISYVDDTVPRLAAVDIGLVDGAIVAKLELASLWGSGWSYKVRQLGPAGSNGVDGNQFIVVRSRIFGDSRVLSLSAVRTVRSNFRGDLSFIKQDLTAELPIAHLRASADVGFVDFMGLGVTTLDQASPSWWASVAPTAEAAKPIMRWGLAPKLADTIMLNLPIWTPTGECGGKVPVEFDWFTNLDLPFTITVPPNPAAQCCEEEFFYNPNVGGGPCAIEFISE